MTAAERELRTAVVTGGTGAIGVALCEKLLAEGCTVYAAVNPNSRRTDNLPQHERLQLIPCDAAAYDTLPEKIGAADAFFHLAWAKTTGSGRNDMPAQIANIRYAIDAVRAANRLGCKVFVGAGSQAEYGRVEGMLHPDTPCFAENGYGMAKCCAGQMTRTESHALGMAHIWLRVLSVYGEYDGAAAMIPAVILQLLRGEMPALTKGEQLWDYLYAADAANAFYLAAAHGRDGAVYPVGSGEARPLREYVTELRDAIDENLPLGFGERAYADKQVMHLQADITPLHDDTGFTPQVSFSEGIRRTIAFYRAHPNG